MNLVGGRQGRIEGRGAWWRVEGSSLGEFLPNPTWPGLGAGEGSSWTWCWRGELLSPMFALHQGPGELRWLLICHNRGQTFSWGPQIRDYTGNRDSGTPAPPPRCYIWWAGPKSGAQAKLLVQYPGRLQRNKLYFGSNDLVLCIASSSGRLC